MTDLHRTADAVTPALSEAPDRATAAASVRDAFATAYGTEPEGVWSAPGRVNIIGEHVDYQDGLCLPMAISHRCFVAAARTDTGTLRLRSVQSDETIEAPVDGLAPGSVQSWGAYVAGVLWALGEQGEGDVPSTGLDILVDGHVPLGSGLSSSASLECAAAEAFDALLSLGTTRLDRVRACITAETEFAGASTGGLDQSASVLCTAGHALLLDCRDFSTQVVPWDLASQGLALLICDTRAEHSHVDGEYTARRRDSERAAELIGVDSLRDVDPARLDEALARIDDEVVRRRARHVVTEIQRVRDVAALLEESSVRDRVDELGVLLNASHDSLRDDYEVTVPALDIAVDAAREAGAHGARMTGGGFGGSIIALVEADRLGSVAAAIAQAFDREQLTAPELFVALPSDGSGRDL